MGGTPVLFTAIDRPAALGLTGRSVVESSAERGLHARRPLEFGPVVGSGGGTYKVTSAPAGDYLVVAVSGALGVWKAPDFLERLERVATRVTLSWGQETTQDLTVREVRWPCGLDVSH